MTKNHRHVIQHMMGIRNEPSPRTKPAREEYPGARHIWNNAGTIINAKSSYTLDAILAISRGQLDKFQLWYLKRQSEINNGFILNEPLAVNALWIRFCCQVLDLRSIICTWSPVSISWIRKDSKGLKKYQ